MSHAEEIRIGVSACLLGEKVRYDGRHKKHDYVVNTLSRFFTWVPVCPEVEIGLGVPREPVQLLGKPERPRFVATRTGADHTESIYRYARLKAEELAGLDLCGFILKKDSPSCGMERVPVYDENGEGRREGAGVFARALMQRLPLLPVEEEGRLEDPRRQEHFIVRVFSYNRWQKLAAEFSVEKLSEFHARHKLLLMAHSRAHLRELDQLLVAARAYPLGELRSRYAAAFFQGLRRRAARRGHVAVLRRLATFCKPLLSPLDEAELLTAIEDYRKGSSPRSRPLSLIRDYAARLGLSSVQEQVYVNPHPKELSLLNRLCEKSN